MDQYAEQKRTEKNLIERSGISEAETTTNKRRFVLKLYRHEASRGFFCSRGFFATAELLVLPFLRVVCCVLSA